MKPMTDFPPRPAVSVGHIEQFQVDDNNRRVTFTTNSHSLSIRILSTGIVHLQLHNGEDIFHDLIRPLLEISLQYLPLEVKPENDTWSILAGPDTTVTVTRNLEITVLRTGTPCFYISHWMYAGTGVFCRLHLTPKERIFGLGEKTGALDKRGKLYTQWTTDVHPHTPSTDAMYQALPVTVLADPTGSRGLFLANTYRTYFDCRSSNFLGLGADDGPLSLYLFPGPTLKQVLYQYTDVTGRIPLPPRWALGFQQSRYSYPDQKRVGQIAEEFRKRKIPLDVIYLDIDYMDGYRIFTWNPNTFQNPAHLIENLDGQGVRIVTIIDPGIKDDTSFPVYRSGIAEDVFMRYANGEAFRSHVWPGQCVFPDFVRPSARKWWARLVADFVRPGIAGIWNDMNEPALFGADPKNPTLGGFANDAGLIHVADDSRMVSHDGIHNTYALFQAAATYEGLFQAGVDNDGGRPFILSRSGFPGIQKYAAVWTGDNSSWWEHLAMAIPMCLNLGLSGVPFVGPDIGGFFDSPTPELFARWIEAGVFFPFARIHSDKGTLDQEPWSYGRDIEAIARRYISYRYRLLPLLETLFEESHRTGSPIMRPLFWEFPDDAVAYDISDEFLLGRGLLVAPILQSGADQRLVYLPQGAWYDPWTGNVMRGPGHHLVPAPLHQIPLFLRAGTVLPIGRKVFSTKQLQGDWKAGRDGADMFWIIRGHGKFVAYSDDGSSQDYSQDVCRRIEMAIDDDNHQTSIVVTPTWNKKVPNVTKSHRFCVMPYPEPPINVRINGSPVPWRWKARTGLVTFALPHPFQSGQRMDILIEHT